MNGMSGYDSKSPKLSANTNRWTGDFATGRIFGPVDAMNAAIVGFNRKDFDFILAAINTALKKKAKK